MKKLISLPIILLLLLTNAYNIQSQCAASVSANSFDFPANGGTNTFSVTLPSGYSCGWGIQNNYSWLSFSPQGYYTSSTVTVTCAPNTTSSSRTATLTLVSFSFGSGCCFSWLTPTVMIANTSSHKLIDLCILHAHDLNSFGGFKT